MMQRRLALAVIAACSTAAPPPVWAEPRAVVELFTSQGCSSCPAADRLFGELAADPSLVAISLPIDVWDYLGWKDTLAHPRNTVRWQGYSKSRGDRERYTPQVVVNGAVHALGSDRSAIETAIGKSRQNKTVMSVPVRATRASDQLTIELPSGAPAVFASVSVWALAKSVTVAIARGENKGRTITYHNVARQWVDLGPWSAVTHRWSVPLRDLAGDDIDAAVVLVQTGTNAMPSVTLGAAIAPIR